MFEKILDVMSKQMDRKIENSAYILLSLLLIVFGTMFIAVCLLFISDTESIVGFCLILIYLIHKITK